MFLWFLRDADGGFKIGASTKSLLTVGRNGAFANNCESHVQHPRGGLHPRVVISLPFPFQIHQPGMVKRNPVIYTCEAIFDPPKVMFAYPCMEEKSVIDTLPHF